MATIGDIATGSSYKGEAALGGSQGVSITIDPTPIARMAMFSYYRDQNLWEQKQKDDATAAKQIADIAAYDITSPLTQYSDELKSKLNHIQERSRNPKSLVYGRGNKEYAELQEEINKFNTLRQTATASDLIWNKVNEEIQKEPDLQRRSVLQKKLDFRVKQLFEKGVDPNKILNDISEIKPSNYTIPTVATSLTDEFFVDANGNITTQIKKLDLLKLRSDSALEIARGRGTEIDEGTLEFKSLTEDEKDIARQESKLTGRERQNIANLSTSFNNLLQQYKQLHPDASLKDIVGDPSGDNTLKDNIKSANAINEQIRSYNKLVLSGQVQDPTKKVLRQTYDEINLDDGLSEEEIVMMNALQKSGNAIIIEVKKVSQPTGDALQRGHLSAEWARIGIAQQTLDKTNTEDLLSATAVLNQATSILNKGIPVTVNDYDGKGHSKDFLEIADASLLQQFGKVDQNGKLYDVPDAVQYDKENGQLYLVNYNKKDGSVTRSQSGKRQITNRVPLDERDWLGIITRRKNPNKDIGAVNSIIEQALMTSGGSLYKLSQRYSNIQNQQQDKSKTSGSDKPVSKNKGKWDKYAE